MTKLVSRTTCSAFFTVSAMAAALAMVPGPANAGFFEDLFGAHSTPQAPPSFGDDALVGGDGLQAPREIHRHRKHVAMRDDKPVLQKVTDIWHDQTLRDGDAVMMKDGLHVYTGPSGEKPIARDLPRIDRADVPLKERALLVSMDTIRTDPPKSGMSLDAVASGRSVAVTSSAVPGYRITDARGKSVRYVGP